MGRLSFSGRPPLGGASYRGTSGVPPTSGGTVSAPSAPMGRPGGFSFPRGSTSARRWARALGAWQKTLQGYGGAYAALAQLDPAQSRRAFRRYDAYLGQFLPDWYYHWDEWQWWNQGAPSKPGSYPGLVNGVGGWTVNCTGAPLYANKKMVIFPTPPGFGTGSPSPCGAGLNLLFSNCPVGTDIPVGTTRVVFSSGPQPWPATLAQIYERWFCSPPAVAAVPYKVGTIVLPAPLHGWDPDPPVVSEQVAVGRAQPFSVGVAIALSSDGTGNRTPVPPSNPGPPVPGSKERKFTLGKGGRAGDIFGAVTEMSDALTCAVSAIKSNGGPKAPHMGFVKSAQFVAKHFDITNLGIVEDFMSCMVQNHVTDFAIGKLNSVASRQFGKVSGSARGVGVKRGPSPF